MAYRFFLFVLILGFFTDLVVPLFLAMGYTGYTGLFQRMNLFILYGGLLANYLSIKPAR